MTRRRHRKRTNSQGQLDVFRTPTRNRYGSMPSPYGGGGKVRRPKGGSPSLRAKKKIKTGYSNTATQTKKKTKAWSLNQDNGMKFKNVTIAYKPSKRSKATKALSQPGQVYNYSTDGQTSGVGVQAAVVSLQTLGATDIVQFHRALNDDVAITGVRASETFLFRGTKEEIEFVNCSPTTMELDIYVLIDKTSAASSPVPVSVWSAGILQEANDATLPLESAATPWNRPTQVKEFNIHWWSKRYPVTLTAGEKCFFTLNFWRNRMLDTSYCNNFSSIRGITHRLLFVQRGTLVDANNAKTFTAGNQSLSETKLIWGWKRTMYGQILSTLPRVYKQLGTNFPTVLANQWHIDEDTGEAEDAGITTEFA